MQNIFTGENDLYAGNMFPAGDIQYTPYTPFNKFSQSKMAYC